MSKTYLIFIAVILSATFLISPLFGSYAFATTSILNIRHWAASDHTRIVIDTSDEANIKITKAARIVTIEFSDAQYPEEMSPELVLKKPGIDKILISPLPQSQVKVELMLSDGTEASVFKLKEIQDKPFRVVIDLNFPDVEKKEREDRQKFKTAVKDKIIVIDPGHGGEDSGAIGLRKTMEKDVVLTIAQKLEWLLNHRKGYRAFLTRTGDYYPSFKKRLQIARDYGADLFISIHADAVRSRQPYGSSVYCLSTKGASSVAARLLARQENLADIIGGSDNDAASEGSDPITLDMIQTQTINISKAFGTNILEHLKEFNAIKFPRIQEAPFIVLKLPHIPSILVETGYISNPREELLLRSNRHQNRIALALCNSIQESLRGAEPPDKDAVQIALDEERENAKNKKQIAPPRQETESRPLPRMVLYKVRKTDTLESISKKFNTSPDAILRLNQLQRSDSLADRRLKIYLPAGEERISDRPAVAESPAQESAQTTPKAPTPPSIKPVIHQVKKGESLTVIASKYGVPPATLAAENGIKPGKALLIGKRLKIPLTEQAETPDSPVTLKRKGPDRKADSESPARESAQTTPKAPTPPSIKPVIHQVKKGESLTVIASKYGVSPATLAAENGIKPGKALLIGKRLKIPLTEQAETPDSPVTLKRKGPDRKADSESPVQESAQTTPKAPTPPSIKPVIHQVKKGESLTVIASKYGVSPATLAAENGIKPGKALLIGKRLKIPLTEQAETPDDTALPKKPEKPKIHVVKRGETLEKIARKYDVSLVSLLKENNMKMKDALWVNRKIRIP